MSQRLKSKTSLSLIPERLSSNKSGSIFLKGLSYPVINLSTQMQTKLFTAGNTDETHQGEQPWLQEQKYLLLWALPHHSANQL